VGSAQEPLSLNRFLYAAANPATLIDPDGHKSVYEGGGCGPDGRLCGGLGGDHAASETATTVAGGADTHRTSSSGGSSGTSTSTTTTGTADTTPISGGTKPGMGTGPEAYEPLVSDQPETLASDFGMCFMGPGRDFQSVAAANGACARAEADAAATVPDCGVGGTACLKDLAGVVSATTATAALVVMVASGGIGAPVSGSLMLVSGATGLYSTVGTCAYGSEGSCAVSTVATGLGIVSPAAGVLRILAPVARDIEIAWNLTVNFMAEPFVLAGPFEWMLQQVRP
jgi:hypothetical protein